MFVIVFQEVSGDETIAGVANCEAIIDGPRSIDNPY
jgi:hypothetical protein